MSYILQPGVDYTGVTIVFLCHDGKGNILLNKRRKNCRDEQECWDPGGGGLEFNDSVEETLKKEIKEEYCKDVLSYEFLGFRDIHRQLNGKPTHWVSIDFKVLVDRSKVKNGEPHKFDDLGWFQVNTLPTPLHSQFPEFLKKYKNKLPYTITNN
jgi:8-oxo-dGTP diphosphatase